MRTPTTEELITLTEGGPWWAEYLASTADELLTDEGKRWLADLYR
jgi:hypothetical protein